ncbi:MAG: ABC transporter permease [Elusimicrobiota bacterium]
MYLIKIALRNLFRRPVRTVMVAGMLSAAVLVFLTFDTFMMGLLEVSFGNIIDFETPHIEIAREKFFEYEDTPGKALPLQEAFTADEAMMEEVRKLEGFQSQTAVIDFSANFVGPREDYPVVVRAIEPESFSRVFRNEEYLVEGEFLREDGSGLIIGRELAKLFELEVGDYYTLLFRDVRDSFNTIEGEIRGIVATPHPEMNQNFVLLCREHATGGLGLEHDKITQVMVRLDNRDAAQEQAAYLNRVLEDKGYSGYKARSYHQASQMLTSLETWAYIENYSILALILLVGAIGIVNVVVLSAMERAKEIGMMKAMGLKESDIVRVFVFESGGIGVIGGLLGCALGAVIVGLFSTYGIELAAIYGGVELEIGIPVIGNIYGVWNPWSFVMVFAFVVILSMLASIYPSYWAARKDPVDVINLK